MSPALAATALRVLWLAVEYPYLRRYSVKPARDWDRRSALLWDLANALEPVGMAMGFLGVGRMKGAGSTVGWVGVALLVAGVGVRWSAIRALGKFFTGVVLIREGHRLMREGPYRHVRHPAYAGSLVAHLGLGLSFVNWFSLGFGVVPFVVAAAYRMRVEERALREAFGAEYDAYARATKRLIPKLF